MVTPTQTPQTRTKPLIVIVDDDERSRDLLCGFLERVGLETLCVTNGEEAHSLIKDKLPNLVLIDLALSDNPLCKSGWAVMTDILADPLTATIPAVTVSAYIDDSTIRQAKQAGFIDCISKPLQAATLYAVVKKILSKG